MKNVFLKASIACCLAVLASGFGTAGAQTRTAVVTGISQVVRLSPAVRSVVSEKSFPDYLSQRPDLQNSIFETVRTSLAAQLAVGAVTFRQPAGGWLDYGNVVAAMHIDRNRGNGDLYVGIQQVIQLTTTAADSVGMPVRNFLGHCTVRVEDGNGKVVFENKIAVPFSTVSRAGQMQGGVETSPDDWTRLLGLSIKSAFEHKTKRLPTQVFSRPPLAVPGFAVAGGYYFFTLQETESFGSYKGASRRREITFREQDARQPIRLTYEQSYSLNESYFKGEYRSRVLLKDIELGTEYDITAATGLVRDSMNYLSKTISPINTRCTAQRLLVGDYTMDGKKFEGQAGYDVYSVRAILPRNTFEIRVNDKVRAVVQKGGLRSQATGRRQTTYFQMPRQTTAAEQDKLLLTYLIYQLSAELGRDFLGY